MNPNNRERIALAIFALAILGQAAASVAGTPRYRLTILGDHPQEHVIAMGMNDAGWSVGYHYDPAASPTTASPFVTFRDGSMTSIPIPTVHDGLAAAINDHGTVAGTFDLGPDYSSGQHLFRFTADGTFVDLGTLGGRRGEVADMNNRGDIVGSWSDPVSQRTKAFRYSDENGWEILHDADTVISWATDINERGDVVGNVQYAFNDVRAWHWKDGVLTNLGSFGGMEAHAYYVNNSGVVVGDAAMADGSLRAFRWSQSTGMTPLPLLDGASSSRAFWITDDGIIGGVQYIPHNEYHAFIYSDALGLVDLGLNIGADWEAPVAMNEAGEIVFRTFGPDEYVITPVVYSAEFGLHDLNQAAEGEWPFVIHEPVSINACGEITAVAWNSFDLGVEFAVSVLLTPIRPGDLDEDSDVDLADYAILQANFNTAVDAGPRDGDLDGDGDVDSADAASFLSALREPCR